jgi:hypothetical protein
VELRNFDYSFSLCHHPPLELLAGYRSFSFTGP